MIFNLEDKRKWNELMHIFCLCANSDSSICMVWNVPLGWIILQNSEHLSNLDTSNLVLLAHLKLNFFTGYTASLFDNNNTNSGGNSNSQSISFQLDLSDIYKCLRSLREGTKRAIFQIQSNKLRIRITHDCGGSVEISRDVFLKSELNDKIYFDFISSELVSMHDASATPLYMEIDSKKLHSLFRHQAGLLEVTISEDALLIESLHGFEDFMMFLRVDKMLAYRMNVDVLSRRSRLVLPPAFVVAQINLAKTFRSRVAIFVHANEIVADRARLNFAVLSDSFVVLSSCSTLFESIPIEDVQPVVAAASHVVGQQKSQKRTFKESQLSFRDRNESVQEKRGRMINELEEPEEGEEEGEEEVEEGEKKRVDLSREVIQESLMAPTGKTLVRQPKILMKELYENRKKLKMPEHYESKKSKHSEKSFRATAGEQLFQMKHEISSIELAQVSPFSTTRIEQRSSSSTSNSKIIATASKITTTTTRTTTTNRTSKSAFILENVSSLSSSSKQSKEGTSSGEGVVKRIVFQAEPDKHIAGVTAAAVDLKQGKIDGGERNDLDLIRMRLFHAKERRSELTSIPVIAEARLATKRSKPLSEIEGKEEDISPVVSQVPRSKLLLKNDRAIEREKKMREHLSLSVNSSDRIVDLSSTMNQLQMTLSRGNLEQNTSNNNNNNSLLFFDQIRKRSPAQDNNNNKNKNQVKKERRKSHDVMKVKQNDTSSSFDEKIYKSPIYLMNQEKERQSKKQQRYDTARKATTPTSNYFDDSSSCSRVLAALDATTSHSMPLLQFDRSSGSKSSSNHSNSFLPSPVVVVAATAASAVRIENASQNNNNRREADSMNKQPLAKDASKIVGVTTEAVKSNQDSVQMFASQRMINRSRRESSNAAANAAIASLRTYLIQEKKNAAVVVGTGVVSGTILPNSGGGGEKEVVRGGESSESGNLTGKREIVTSGTGHTRMSGGENQNSNRSEKLMIHSNEFEEFIKSTEKQSKFNVFKKHTQEGLDVNLSILNSNANSRSKCE